MPYVRSSGAEIHYSTLPEASAAGRPVITFVHGGGGNLYGFLCQMPYFAAQGFFAISISVRGFGSSRLDGDDATLFAFDRLASDVIAVLDAVGAPATALVGHSIGGFYVAAMARDAPERLTHAVFSSTFYGLVDEATSPPWLTRLLDHPYGSGERDELALELRPHLPLSDVARGSEAEQRGSVRAASRFPHPPDNFGPGFRQARPELCWLYDATNDGSTQKVALNLGRRFRVLHDDSITPTELRRAYAGPILFTTTECDAAVHWETVSLIAEQMRRADRPDGGKTMLHWFDGPVGHAPYMEAADQYNATLLRFLGRDGGGNGGGDGGLSASCAAMPAFAPAPALGAPLATRQYALLVSGTLNPPHIGHVRLGLHAAAALEAEGHTVASITFVPVHDNYMHNKAMAAGGAGAAGLLYPMAERCKLLVALIEAEAQRHRVQEGAASRGETASGLVSRCRVLNYEGDHGAELLDESPGYWAKKLPDGYLKTVPTMGLLGHFAHAAKAEGARVGVVFGVDNLAGMSTWNAPANLLHSADLVLVARAMAAVEFPKDPSALLSAVGRIETRAAVPVAYPPAGGVLFGASVGTLINCDPASKEGVLYLLPPLRGDDEGLSSTSMRKALEGLVGSYRRSGEASLTSWIKGLPNGHELPPTPHDPNFESVCTLLRHGYHGRSEIVNLLECALRGPDALRQIGEASVARGERVGSAAGAGGGDGDRPQTRCCLAVVC